MEQADWVQSVKLASLGTPSNELKSTTVSFLLKFQANKRLSESLINLKTMIQILRFKSQTKYECIEVLGEYSILEKNN